MAVQLAFGEIREKSVNKPDGGRFKKINQPAAHWTREFRLDKADRSFKWGTLFMWMRLPPVNMSMRRGNFEG